LIGYVKKYSYIRSGSQVEIAGNIINTLVSAKYEIKRI